MSFLKVNEVNGRHKISIFSNGFEMYFKLPHLLSIKGLRFVIVIYLPFFSTALRKKNHFARFFLTIFLLFSFIREQKIEGGEGSHKKRVYELGAL